MTRAREKTFNYGNKISKHMKNVIIHIMQSKVSYQIILNEILFESHA